MSEARRKSPEPLPWPVTEVRRSWWRRHPRLAWTLAILICAAAALLGALAIAAHRFEPYLRARILDELQERFHARVELDEFHVSLHHGQQATWGLWATGRGLRVWPPHVASGDHPLEAAVESKPLVRVEEFSFHSPLRYRSDKPMHVPEVRLSGLLIEVPPGPERDRNSGFESALNPRGVQPGAGQPRSLANVTVDRVLCQNAHLTLETDKPGKTPLTFDIPHLTLTHLRAGEPMSFVAEVANPEPRGTVFTSGSFGPWIGGDPGNSLLSGQYQFRNANMSTFRGIAGTLNSDGRYAGTLRALAVNGTADVSDFRLTHFGNALPLHTRFSAHVDGTNGDTHLDSVDATLGRSHFTTSGDVVRVGASEARKTRREKPSAARIDTTLPSAKAGTKGHRIDLKVNIDRGNMADFMRLVSKSSTPILTGNVRAQASLLIPPGPAPVHLRMKLDGRFMLDDARFTSEKVQKRVEELSLRGQGKPHDLNSSSTGSIRSSMSGGFSMADGVITLPRLDYSVPGAQIQLAGTYALDGALHFDGAARMQASVSQMVGGWKGFLLKPVDGLFRKQGAGALVPIRIRGTREQPDFGVDLGRIGHTSPQRPDRR